MGLVDLRGRELEPEVVALLDPDPSWIVVGREPDGSLGAASSLELD